MVSTATAMPGTAETIDDLKRDFEHLAPVWEKSHQLFTEIDGEIHQTRNIWAGVRNRRGRPNFHSPRGTSILDAVADNQLPYKPQFHREPLGPGPDDKQEANEIETYAATVWDDAGLYTPYIPVKQLNKHMAAYGYTVFKGAFLVPGFQTSRPVPKDGEEKNIFEERVENWETGRATKNPFRLEAPHPATVLMDPRFKNPPKALVIENFFANDLKQLTELKAETSFRKVTKYDIQGDPYDSIPTLARWDGSHFTIQTLDGDHIMTEVTANGIQPYSHAFSGWGMETTNQLKLDPVTLCRGVIGPILEVLKLMQQERAARHDILMRSSFLRRINRADPVEARRALQGNILQGQQGDWSWEQPPQVPGWVLELGQELEREIELAASSLTFSGFRQEGVSTVGQHAAIAEAAQGKLEPMVMQINHLATIAAQHLLQLHMRVPALKKGFNINGLTLPASKLRGNDNIKVSFKMSDPAIRAQSFDRQMTMYNAGLQSKEGFWDAEGFEDPNRIRDGMIEDRVDALPDVQKLQEQIVIERDGLDVALKDLQEQRAAAEAEASLGTAALPGAPTPSNPVDAPVAGGGAQASAVQSEQIGPSNSGV